VEGEIKVKGKDAWGVEQGARRKDQIPQTPSKELLCIF
jgi:hypothetical protein